MSRFKFRAKDLKTGEWVEYDPTRMMPNIDHATICEWTGLNDKRGRPIYEGDIVQSPIWKAR